MEVCTLRKSIDVGTAKRSATSCARSFAAAPAVGRAAIEAKLQKTYALGSAAADVQVKCPGRGAGSCDSDSEPSLRKAFMSDFKVIVRNNGPYRLEGEGITICDQEGRCMRSRRAHCRFPVPLWALGQ